MLAKDTHKKKPQHSRVHFNPYSYNLMIFIWLISGRGLFVPDFSFQKVEAMVVLTISACLCYYFELTNEIRFLTLDKTLS